MRIHRTAEEGGDLELYYFHDLNRNVIALMDRAGTQPAARYEYTAFGELTVCEGTWATANPFRFSNEYWDDDLGLVYYNYRYYAPAIGRWLSADPIGLAGGSNLYAMLGNNPVNFTDYLGLMEGGTDQAMAIMGKNVVYQSIDGQYHNFPQGFVKDHLDKAKTWAKATGNSLQQACSFGVWGPDYYAFGEPSLRDKVNGYETAAIVSRIGSELALGWITGYGGTMVFAAKLTIGMRFACGAMFIIDSSRNLYDTYQGVMAIAENGLSFQSSLQLFGGAFGLSGNIAGFTRGLSKVDGIINKDVEYLFKHAKYKTTPMDECFKGMIKGENSIWRKKNTLVEYFGKKGRQACKINIIDGKLYDVAGKVFDTTGEGEMIYVMDEIGEIFAKRGISGQIHHSSFFAGQPVAAAGSIIVKDGVIHDITSNSGHYVPEEEFYQQVLQELRSRGANLNNLRR
jgi:RHS repeat-associated protein